MQWQNTFVNVYSENELKILLVVLATVFVWISWKAIFLLKFVANGILYDFRLRKMGVERKATKYILIEIIFRSVSLENTFINIRIRIIRIITKLCQQSHFANC